MRFLIENTKKLRGYLIVDGVETALIKVFIGYVVCVIFFSAIYYCLYSFSGKKSFADIPKSLELHSSASNIDVLEKKINDIKIHLQHLKKFNDKLLILHDFCENPNSEKSVYEKSVRCVADEDNLVYTVMWSENYAHLNSALIAIKVSNIDSGAELHIIHSVHDYLIPNNSDLLKIVIVRWIKDFEVLYKELTSELNYRHDNNKRELGFVDFVYFSVVTQTTIGYGDISPKSSLARILVIVQILLSSFIVFVVLVCVSGENKAKSHEESS